MKKALICIGIMMLMLFSVSFSQFKLDTTMVAANTYSPTLATMEYAYFQKWESTLKDTIILLRPKQYFSIFIDTVYNIKLDTIVGSGANRTSSYTISRNGVVKKKFQLPYTLVHSSDISFDNEPLFKWSKVNVAYTVRYQLQVSVDSMFSTLTINDSALVDTFSYSGGRLENNTKYYCRVRTLPASGNSPWTNYRSFTTYAAARFQIQDRFLIVEPILITNATNPLNRQAQLRVRYHKIPQMLYYGK